MGAAVLTLAAAVLGGVVSLVSVWITQRSAQRVTERESERIERHRQEDWEKARLQRLYEERQAGYVRFSAATRVARDVLAACMHDFQRAGRLDDARRAELQERWDAYVAQHAEAHIIVSNDVLGAVGQVNGALRQIYGVVKRLDVGPQRPNDNLEALQRRLDGLWDHLVTLREVMRRDLGLAEPADAE
ncbi:hypothetical protein ACIPSA_46155 [Streptomyces sp. NPDC086549]|uniref:hypothetical protein n=1 Tax=Streptomyces sp. NPDC086549 TaxID=3365752 RepID=UPI0038072575